MGGTHSGEWVNEGGAVGDCGGVAVTEKQSSSQVSCGEVVAVSATFTDDTNQHNTQLIFNVVILVNLERSRVITIVALVVIYSPINLPQPNP